jgi:hypothetical protein
MSRSTRLGNLSEIFGEAAVFVVKECCFSASNGSAAVVEPQYEELLRNAGVISEFRSIMAGIKLKIE